MVRRGVVLVHGLAFAIALLTVYPAGVPGSSIGAWRNLTHAEIVGASVHDAETIVVADFVAERLTNRDSLSGRGGRLPYRLTFRTRRTLKGPDLTGEIEVCDWPRQKAQDAFYTRLEGPANAPFTGRTFVLFLRRPTGLNPDFDACPWIETSWGPALSLPAFSPWTTALETEVRRALSDQSPASLSLRAQRIVLGTVEGEIGDGKSADPGRTVVRVTRTLKGPRSSRIPLSLVDPRIPVGQRPQIFFLRPIGGGVYEPLELAAGVLAVEKNRVPAWNMSLEEVEREIARAGTRN